MSVGSRSDRLQEEGMSVSERQEPFLPGLERKFEASLEPGRTEKLNALLRRYVEEVLAICGGNKAKAARRLGVTRKTIYRRLEWKDVE